MTQEHKHYTEALMLARKIYTNFERISTTTKYEIDENKAFYSLSGCARFGLAIYFSKGNGKSLLSINMAYKPKKAALVPADTNWLKVSHSFMSYIKNNCTSRGSVKYLLDILPSYRHMAVNEILADLDSH